MTLKCKNDIAWEKLFNKHRILEHINNFGFYEINAREINIVREARLMAKFDHYINLPAIFKKNQISILPVTRSKYILGNFEAYKNVVYDETLPQIVLLSKEDPIQSSVG
ncbi:MAG: type II restriction enzyme [Bacillota bacterium]